MNIGKPSNKFFQLPFMRRTPTMRDNSEKNELRLPLIGFLPNKARNHFVACVGEFCGTFLFLFFAFAGTQVANADLAVTTGDSSDTDLAQAPNADVLLYVALSFGFSLAVNAWCFFRISGGLFNPAVTLALAMIGAISWLRAVLVFIAEIVASIAAAYVVSALYPGKMAVTTSLGTGVSTTRGFFIEMFLTTELIFTILMLAAEKHKGTFLAPIGIGLALFVAELAGVFFTGGSLNPARSFGPAVALLDFPSYHWIYWIGPCLGAIIAVGFYRFVKMLEYETANPGQDFNEKENENFSFDEANAARATDARPSDAMARPDPFGSVDSNMSPMASRKQINPPGSGARVDSADADSNTKMHPGYGLRYQPSQDSYATMPQAESGDLGANSRPSNGRRGPMPAQYDATA